MQSLTKPHTPHYYSKTVVTLAPPCMLSCYDSSFLSMIPKLLWQTLRHIAFESARLAAELRLWEACQRTSPRRFFRRCLRSLGRLRPFAWARKTLPTFASLSMSRWSRQCICQVGWLFRGPMVFKSLVGNICCFWESLKMKKNEKSNLSFWKHVNLDFSHQLGFWKLVNLDFPSDWQASDFMADFENN